MLYVCRAHRVDACEPTRAGLRTARPNPNGDLPYNTVESLVMGKLVNAGATSVNLRGAWLVVPFSRGVHTKYEG